MSNPALIGWKERQKQACRSERGCWLAFNSGSILPKILRGGSGFGWLSGKRIQGKTGKLSLAKKTANTMRTTLPLHKYESRVHTRDIFWSQRDPLVHSSLGGCHKWQPASKQSTLRFSECFFPSFFSGSPNNVFSQAITLAGAPALSSTCESARTRAKASAHERGQLSTLPASRAGTRGVLSETNQGTVDFPHILLLYLFHT